ncbi:MAG: glycosyltransferase [Parcubacteria group bacterium]|nr:glycosyltransferase [Parcubacteria group bacterium]
MEKVRCTVEVLTYNSEQTLGRCLESVKDFDDIIVLDGNSTDQTRKIAKQYHARIVPQRETNKQNIRIEHFADVRNKGIALAKHDWFLYIDSDEYLSQAAVEEIRGIIARGKDNIYFAYNLPRVPVVGKKIIDRLRPSYQVRFFYLPAVEGFIKRIHERITIKIGYQVGTLLNPEYVPLEDISVLQEKWSGYIDMQLQDIVITPKILFLKTSANIKKFFKYWVKYAIGLVRRPRSRLPFWYEYHNAAYHLRIVWRLWRLYITKKI